MNQRAKDLIVFAEAGRACAQSGGKSPEAVLLIGASVVYVYPR